MKYKVISIDRETDERQIDIYDSPAEFEQFAKLISIYHEHDVIDVQHDMSDNFTDEENDMIDKIDLINRIMRASLDSQLATQVTSINVSIDALDLIADFSQSKVISDIDGILVVLAQDCVYKDDKYRLEFSDTSYTDDENWRTTNRVFYAVLNDSLQMIHTDEILNIEHAQAIYNLVKSV
jgi:hypothetical protein